MTARAVIAVFTLLLVAACGPQPGGPHTYAVTPIVGSPQIRGVAYHGMWISRSDADRAAILDAIAASGVGWVRLDVGWSTLQPDPQAGFTGVGVEQLDVRLREISERGLSALVMLWWAPAWSSGTDDKRGLPADPKDYAAAAAWMVQRWPEQIAALQVWNEPNLPEFFAGTSALDYARLLKATYPAVKGVRPDLTVVSAAPANLDAAWYEDFFDAGAVGSYDALGAHPYPVVGDLPADQCAVRVDSGCNLDWLVRYKAINGDPNSPIWVTEFGYSVHADDPRLPAWQAGVTEQQQAEYTADMLAYFGSLPSIEAAYVYRDRDFDDVDVHQDGFGILRSDNTTKPVYSVLTCSPATRCAELAAP